jgi:uncharacterized membrane protein
MSPSWSRGPSFFLFVVVVVCVLLLSGAVVFTTGAVALSEESTQSSDWLSSANSSMTVELQPDGDAHWRVSTSFNLTDSNETTAYRDLAQDFESEGISPAQNIDTRLSILGIDSFERAAAAVDAHTAREMTIEDRELRTANQSEVANGTGRLTIEFRWTNFARSEGGELIVDDVLVTRSGDLWLEGLSESQSLTIVAPEDYGVRDSADGVSPEAGRLHWEGPEEFTDQSLQVTLTGPDSTFTDQTGILSSRALMFGLLPVVAVVVLLVLYLGRVGRINITIPPIGDADSGGQSTEETASPTPVTDPGDEPTEEQPNDGIDEELLSDEERVERLLSMNGGRMKQANIVKETDWSNAKVSQLLSSMEDEGRIDKLRIGRENLISFPDEDITDSDE